MKIGAHLSERRIFSRQALVLPVMVERGSRQAELVSPIAALTRDVSNRGAYLWAQGAFQIGQLLLLSLEVPSVRGRNYTLKVQWEAEVIRVDARRPTERATGVAVRVLRFEKPTVTPTSRPWIN